MRGKVRQSLLHRYRQQRKFLEVLVMSRSLLGLLPQVFNGIVVGRIRRQRMHGEALGMLGQKLRRRLTGMIPRPIMDEVQVCRGVRQDSPPERLITVRSKPSLDALIEQASREILNSAKDLVAFTFATGFDLGLLAAARPRVTSRPPLGKTGLIRKEDQALTPLGGTQDHGPVLLKPGVPPGRVEMV